MVPSSSKTLAAAAVVTKEIRDAIHAYCKMGYAYFWLYEDVFHRTGHRLEITGDVTSLPDISRKLRDVSSSTGVEFRNHNDLSWKWLPLENAVNGNVGRDGNKFAKWPMCRQMADMWHALKRSDDPRSRPIPPETVLFEGQRIDSSEYERDMRLHACDGKVIIDRETLDRIDYHARFPVGSILRRSRVSSTTWHPQTAFGFADNNNYNVESDTGGGILCVYHFDRQVDTPPSTEVAEVTKVPNRDGAGGESHRVYGYYVGNNESEVILEPNLFLQVREVITDLARIQGEAANLHKVKGSRYLFYSWGPQSTFIPLWTKWPRVVIHFNVSRTLPFAA